MTRRDYRTPSEKFADELGDVLGPLQDEMFKNESFLLNTMDDLGADQRQAFYLLCATDPIGAGIQERRHCDAAVKDYLIERMEDGQSAEEAADALRFVHAPDGAEIQSGRLPLLGTVESEYLRLIGRVPL